ncbi:MAG: OmpH/Skp family outer membrane protein, partial [Planctomycetota bacterium]
MKSKVILLINLSLLVILISFIGSPSVSSTGASESVIGSFSSSDAGPLKIGIVSLRTVFMESKQIAAYKQKVTFERQRIQGDLENLGKEIAASEGALKALKRGSSDYISQMKEWIQKKAKLESDKEFFSQALAMEEQRITEDIYKAILQQSSIVAKRKGLALVLEKSEIDFPASSLNQLELVMGTN